MRRLSKTKRAFTLVEMVLVVAIILILAGVTALSVSDILNRQKQARSSVANYVVTVQRNITSQETSLKGYGF